MNRFALPIILALAATFAAAGCKKGQPRTTVIPGQRPSVTDNRNSDLYPPVNPVPNENQNGDERPLANREEFDGMIKDPAAFAAHTIHFGFDSAVVQKGDRSHIEAVAAALAGNPANKVLIEGNCDERGTKEYNIALGERRAIAGRDALVKAGVSPDRIRTTSYGKDKPVDPASNDAAWAKNRRDDFILLLPKAGGM